MTNRTGALALSCLAWIAGAFPASGRAESDPREAHYLEALRIADRHVRKRRARAAAGPFALSASRLRERTGRGWQVGDRWVVAAVARISPMARRTGDPAHQVERVGEISRFRYEVIAVWSGAQPEAVMRVTPIVPAGGVAVDAHVRSVRVRMREDLQPLGRDYDYTAAGRAARRAVGARPVVSPLELLPLELPATPDPDDGAEPRELPRPPRGLAEAARASGWAPRLANSRWFEESDPYGRPVRYLWERGRPWPSYLETPHGYALLLGESEGA
jgi:hypothetical protein